MLQLVSGALNAFNQVMVFIAALFCSALGAALLGDALYWLLRAVRVRGELIGVRQSGQCFQSVYRYALPAGQRYEGTSNQGCSSLSDRRTGMETPLWVIPAHPLRVEEARSHVWTLIGAALLIAGLWLLHYAATAWPLGPMTWLVGALLLAQLGMRVVRTLRRRDKPAAAEAVARTDGPILSIEQLEASPQRQAALAQQQAQWQRWRPVLMLAGPALLALSLYLVRDVARLQSLGYRASGVVQALALDQEHDGSTYHPLVQFTARNGRSVRFEDAVGSNPPSHHVGDRVPVLYLPDDVQRARIDRGVWDYLPALIALMFGAWLCRLAFRHRPAR